MLDLFKIGNISLDFTVSSFAFTYLVLCVPDGGKFRKALEPVADPGLFINGGSRCWWPKRASFSHALVIRYIINHFFPQQGEGAGLIRLLLRTQVIIVFYFYNRSFAFPVIDLQLFFKKLFKWYSSSWHTCAFITWGYPHCIYFDNFVTDVYSWFRQKFPFSVIL